MLQLRQSLHYCEGLFDRIPIGKGRHYHVADNHATQMIVQDSTKHFTLHSIVDSDADMVTMFRADHRHAAEVRHALCRRMEAEPAAGGTLRRGPRVPGRRRRASRDPDRRARHEQRRRRRHRSLLEARRHAARLGRAESAAVLHGRAPPGRRAATCRRRASPRSGGASGARCGGRTSATTRRRAPRRAPSSCASPTSSSASRTR